MLLHDQYGIQTEVRENFCRDSYHGDYYPEATRDVLIFTFPNAKWPILLCLGCHLMRSIVPKDAQVSEWAEAYEKKQLQTTMGKRATRRRCVLCGGDPTTKRDGLRFCDTCAVKVEGLL